MSHDHGTSASAADPSAAIAWQRTITEHRAAVLALALAPTHAVVPLPEAAGLGLAEDVRAPHDLPTHACSSMDGFAVRHADLTAAGLPGVDAVLPVAGDTSAGSGPGALPPGAAWRIMTGAPLPAGADTVVAVERTDIPRGPVPLPERITIHSLPEPAEAVRMPGSDVRAGDIVASASTLLSPLTVGAIAATGVDSVTAHRSPRVRVVATGDELVPLGDAPAEGQLVDCNSWLLAGLARALGHTCDHVTITHDDPERLSAELQSLLADVELLVFTGGASAGAFEVVRQALTPRGVEFGHVAMQPGKPQGVGVLDGVTVLCFPGNPVSAVVSFLVFARPWLDAASGRPETEPLQVVVDDTWTKPAGRAQYMPVRLTAEQGRLLARRRSEGGSQSHLATRLAGVDGFVHLPVESEGVTRGELADMVVVP